MPSQSIRVGRQGCAPSHPQCFALCLRCETYREALSNTQGARACMQNESRVLRACSRALHRELCGERQAWWWRCDIWKERDRCSALPHPSSDKRRSGTRLAQGTCGCQPTRAEACVSACHNWPAEDWGPVQVQCSNLVRRCRRPVVSPIRCCTRTHPLSASSTATRTASTSPPHLSPSNTHPRFRPSFPFLSPARDARATSAFQSPSHNLRPSRA